MKRDLKTLADTEFDVVVIGGGVFGACAAWDAAQRGLSVALIERGDFCGATSASHLKMVHGGIRYIQHGDIYRVRQSSAERRAFLRTAPHLVEPLPIAIPTYGHGMKGKEVLRIGMGLYDVLTADRNRGIDDPDRQIPWAHSIGKDEVLDMFPGLNQDGLTGAAVFSDGQMFNPPRLVLGFVQSAEACGACVANYVEATGFVRSEDRVSAVAVRDVLTGTDFEVRGRVVLNAAGPFAERLLERSMGKPLETKGVYSRDACFIVNRQLLGHGHALALQTTTCDPDARFSRGARHLFLAPWRDYTLIGVWHVVWEKDPDSVTVTEEELESFIAEVNEACPSMNLKIDDVSLWNAGLVPFGENAPGAKDLRYGHRSRMIDHAETDGVENLVTLIGVRFTTGRFEAEKAIDLVFRKLGRPSPGCQTAETPIVGGDIEAIEAYRRKAVRECEEVQPERVVTSLVRNYGTRFRKVLEPVDGDPDLGRTVGDSPTILAQVVHAVRDEMAQNLADVVFRRTDLGSGSYPGSDGLRQCADILARELGWDESRVKREIDTVVARFPKRVTERADDAPLPVEA